MTTHAKVEILMSGEWLYGSVNRGEFAKAIAPDAKRTFKFTRWHRRGGASVAVIRGWLVEGWDWETPRAPVKRKARTKPTTRIIRGANEYSGSAPLTEAQNTDLLNAIDGLDPNAVAMLCIAANVISVDYLTQATLPVFREALAAYCVVRA